MQFAVQVFGAGLSLWGVGVAGGFVNVLVTPPNHEWGFVDRVDSVVAGSFVGTDWITIPAGDERHFVNLRGRVGRVELKDSIWLTGHSVVEFTLYNSAGAASYSISRRVRCAGFSAAAMVLDGTFGVDNATGCASRSGMPDPLRSPWH